MNFNSVAEGIGMASDILCCFYGLRPFKIKIKTLFFINQHKLTVTRTHHLLKWFWLSQLRVCETQPSIFHGESKTKKCTRCKAEMFSLNEWENRREAPWGPRGAQEGQRYPEPGCHAVQGEQLHVLTWVQLPAFGSRAAEVGANKGFKLNVFDVFSVFYESTLCNFVEDLLYGIFCCC